MARIVDPVQRAHDLGVADVCLLLEGTYPFVRGGVSSWVHRLLTQLPELRFSIVFLGASQGDYGEPSYTMPANVIHFEKHFLRDAREGATKRPRFRNHDHGGQATAMFQYFAEPTANISPKSIAMVLLSLGSKDGLSRTEFLHAPSSWKSIRSAYLRYCPDDSFIDYFWTVRSMFEPLFTLAEIAREVPPARIYHTISTGYAGLLGMLLARRTGQSFVLTEHGIYTKERLIDLLQADWIPERGGESTRSRVQGISPLRKLWIRFFEGMGRLAYDAADSIISLYELNRDRQVSDGALEERTQVIANGIDLVRFSSLADNRIRPLPRVVGMIGRVVPIKDIRTFIQAMHIVCATQPDVEAWIVGPLDEDRGYAKECIALVKKLKLDDRVQFLGFQNTEEILPKLTVSVLTSLSEAQPLVLLEGFAAGVPAVTTDVGACREMIEGRDLDDRLLGTAGITVREARPETIAGAILQLLCDEVAWKRAQRTGLDRVRRYYSETNMISAYRQLYTTRLTG